MTPLSSANSLLPGKTSTIEDNCPNDICQCEESIHCDGTTTTDGKETEDCSCDIASYCEELIDRTSADFSVEDIQEGFQQSEVIQQTFLYCGIVTGNIQLWMITYYAVNALEFLLSIAGLLAILMIIVGSYYYIAGGVTDDKEKGKTIIKYAIGGLVVATSAWGIVNLILLLVTS